MRKLAIIGLGVWIAILWLIFVTAQQVPFLRESNLADYLAGMGGAIAVVIIALGIGLRILGDPDPTIQTLPVGLAVGIGVIALITLAVGALNILYGYVLWLAVAILGLISWRTIANALRTIFRSIGTDLHPAEILLAALIAFALAISLINCLAPLVANDALVYHLNLPKIYVDSHHLARLPFNVYANMPHNGEMLYTALYAMAGETGARGFYFVLIVIAASTLYWAARAHSTRLAALVATSAFIVQPLIVDHRIVCNVDILLTFLTLTAVVLLGLDRTGPLRKSLVFGILLGFMLGVKYTSIGIVIGIIVAWLLVTKNRSLKHLVITLLVALAVFTPWMIKNELYAGNPFYPMLVKVFGGINWDGTQSQRLISWQRSMGMGRSLADYLTLPLNIFLRGKPGLNYARFDGTLTPVPLILLPLVFLRRNRRIYSLLVVAAVGFVFWMLTSQQLRFLMPVVALIALAGAFGLDNLSQRLGTRVVAGVAIAIFAVGLSGLLLPDQYGNPIASSAFCDRLPVVMGFESKHDYLARTLQPYDIFTYANINLPPDEPVLLVWENRAYYLDHPYIADSFFEASSLVRLAEMSQTASDLKHRITSMGIRYVLVNDLLGQVFSRRYSARSINLLKELIGRYMQPIHSSNKLTLYEIVDSPY